ncbi:unnamed protein product [Durusdinium trenchii]|uniref:PARP-type domain-containing protein n=1 Tax=Durusdinium trenchii TaxID=1381693 RepID=A0ABP0QHY7_9DINO
MTIVRDHDLIKHWVEDQVLPKKRAVAGILKRSGLKYADHKSTGPLRPTRTSQESMQNKAKRVKKAATRKLRKVSGWNIFQREKLKGLATSLEPSAYKAQVKALSREWKNAAQEDRAAYVVQAEYEHSIREKLVDKPLPAKGQAPLKEEAVVGSRALQKLAVCRLINNYKIAESHPIWTSDATMGCSMCALKPEMLDTVKSDEECCAFLREALHAPFKPLLSEGAVLEVPEPPCHLQHGMCICSDFFPTARQFVVAFHSALVGNSVKTGDLLHIIAGDCGESHLVFLGAILRRPTCHVLLHTMLQDDMLCHFPEPCFPVASTSLQLFHQMLASQATSGFGPAFQQVQVEVLKYDLSVSLERKVLCIDPGNVSKTFIVNINAPSVPRKPRAKLPFGLAMPKTKITKQRTTIKVKRSGAGAKAKSKGAGKGKKTHRKATGVEDKLEVDAESCESTESDSDSVSSSTTTQTQASQESKAKVSVKGGKCAKDSREIEVDVVMPASNQAGEEEKTARALIAEQEIATATFLQNHETQQRSGMSGGTYFSQEIGLDQGAIAVSGRSKCWFCKAAIPKDTVRFSYFHSRTRPSNWLHSACVAATVRKEQCVEHAKHRLELLLAKPTSSSKQQDSSEARIAAAVSVILQELLSSSSSSSGVCHA